MRHRLNRVLQIATIILALFGTASQASAISLTEYDKNLQKAINALDSLAERNEDETNESYQHRLVETSDSVRSFVPEKESVEYEGSAYNVDNSWLHKKLDEFEALSDTDRSLTRKQLIDRLQSIEERV